MPEFQDPKQVNNNDLRNAQFGGGLINAENVNAGQIGDKNYNIYIGQPSQQKIDIDWHQVSSPLLNEHLRLTTNPLTSGEGITYRTEQVYVPLGLVERKKQSRRKEDVSPEKGSELYHETEITQKFEHQQFLEQVVRNRQSPKSQGKRIAIIGEPGAGKTTLLQQIAQWISKQIEQSVVIWVPLADLRSHDLETYLLEVWLQAIARTAGQAEASTQVKDDFVAQFNRGLVWLVLDGVDEMQSTLGNPLEEIGQQIRQGSLLQQARIVLSCRLNLWDGGRNTLDSFDNYRTLDFSYPQQVEEFICKWFDSRSPSEIQRGQQLCVALREPGKERIRDLIKNPLRLTLLCLNWHSGEGNLPQTKAELYEQFVSYFYEWKMRLFVTTEEQLRRLNMALGNLAVQAIDKEETKFRLRQEFVCEYLGEPDDADSLFGLALRLGWLNKVGVEAGNIRKGVYAFYHPTFQEYFATKSVICNNNCLVASQYIVDRICKTHWQEIFLIAIEMINNIDILVKCLKQKIDNLLAPDEKLQDYLKWLEIKGQVVNIPYKASAVRYFYFILSNNIAPLENKQFLLLHGTFIFSWHYNLGVDKEMIKSLASNFDPDVAFDETLASHSDPTIQLNLDRSLMRLFYKLVQAQEELINNNFIDVKTNVSFSKNQKSEDKWPDFAKLFGNNIEYEYENTGEIRFYSIADKELEIALKRAKIADNNLYKIILKNRRELFRKFDNFTSMKEWWTEKGNYCIEKFRNIILEYRNIGHNWDFDKTQTDYLWQYCDLNKFLIDCLQSNYRVSEQVKEEILDTLWLPMYY